MKIDFKFITEKLKERPSNQWIIFIAMVAMLFMKQAIWHHQFFYNWDIRILFLIYSSVWMSLWVLACKRRPWWTLIIFLAANLWMFSNIVYYRVWDDIITMDEVRNLGNLKGFESSIISDWHWEMLLWLVLPDAIYIAVLCWMKPAKKSRWRSMLIVLALALLFIPTRRMHYYKVVVPFLKGYNTYDPGFDHWYFNHEPLIRPFYEPYNEAILSFANQTPREWDYYSIRDYGIIDYAAAMIAYDYYYKQREMETMGEPVVFSEEDNQLLGELYHPENESFVPQRPLILILVESFESWVIESKDKDGNWVMPNLRKFIDKNNTFYARKVNPMIRQGCSSDGQLMSITGLAPVAKGITTTLYGDQPFPSYARFYQSSRTLNPTPGTWNQTTVNPNYGIKILEESDTMVNDEGLIRRLNSIKLDSISFVFVITESTHVPFEGAENVTIEMDPGMPEKAVRYLKSFHNLDIQLGTFFDRFASIPELRNCDIVITGDHSIMSPHDIEELQTFATKSNNLPSDIEGKKIPLIMYSPALKENTIYEQECYQVDIYPSILSLIGYENPQWEGVGMNLLNNAPRKVEPEQAYVICDKLIRGRYFSSH